MFTDQPVAPIDPIDVQIGANRQDYDRFLVEYGFDRVLVETVVKFEGDQIPMPQGFEGVAVAASPIHGQGMFAKVDFDDGQLIAPARVSGKRTPAGRFTNHSPQPNAVFVPLPGGDLNMVASRHISAGEEVVIDYRQAGRVNGWGGDA